MTKSSEGTDVVNKEQDKETSLHVPECSNPEERMGWLREELGVPAADPCHILVDQRHF